VKSSIQRTVLLVVVCVVCAAFARSAFAAGEDYVKAAKAALPYTVSMVVENRQGSGFIIKSGQDYYVIASNAVVNQIAKVTVETADGHKYETELRGSSPGVGVAVLKMLEVKGALAAAQFGDSKKLEVGEKVIAVGRPQGYGICVTAGIVSGIYKAGGGGEGGDIDFIQTDAAINAGQSGGPLVNLDGDVIGMCLTLVGGGEQPHPQGGGPRPGPRSFLPGGLNFALPIAFIQDAIKQIIREGGVLATVRDFGFGGLQDVNVITMQKLKLANKEGALVINVIKDSPAEQAGIRANDVIIEFNGKPVKSADDLKALAQSVPMGAKVSVKFVGMREEKPVEGTAEIKLPEAESGGISNDAPADGDAVAQADCAVTAISGIPGEGIPVVSATGDAGTYVNAVNRVFPCVIMMENNGSAVMLPKSVAGNNETRYLLTVEHLVQNRKSVKLTFYKGEGEKREAVQVVGEVVGTDPKNDIAVIKVAGVGAPDQIPIANAEGVEYGTEVVAVGSGFNFSATATAGIISVKNYQPREGLANNFWATSARIMAGNDGGALVDKAGRLVGICTNINNNFFRDGVSLFLPAETAIAVARELITTGKTKSGFIGLESVRNLTQEEMTKYKIAGGVAILKVVKGSPAEKAGLKEGQIITKFGNEAVQNREQLKILVGAAEIGKKTPVTLIDTDGNQKTVEIEIAEKE